MPLADGLPVRAYRSGDLGRYRPDGDLEYLGRADRQLKIRGFRVEPAEIESALARHPGVRHAVVIAEEPEYEGGRRERRLVAYIVPEAAATVTEQALRAHVAAILPEYMVPSAFRAIKTLPVTVNGKLDRSMLTMLGTELAGSTQQHRPAASLVEEVLCSLFGEALGRGGIGPEDGFFDLGGHSLAAIRLVNRIRSVLGAEVKVKELFAQQTAAALAASLRGRRAGDGPAAQARPDVIPLSHAQQRLWFLQQINGADRAYHIPYALRLTGRVDRPALEAALADLTAAHEILRTVYPAHEGVPYQRILRPDQARPTLEVRHEAPWRAEQSAAEAARRPFRLAEDPPLRAILFVHGDEDSTLLLVLHHIAGDGWSLGPLMRDLAAAYEARSGGGAPELCPNRVQYADFALWQRRTLGDPSEPGSPAADHLAFWSARLASLPDELDLPVDRPRPREAGFGGGMVPLTLEPGLADRLEAVARSGGATLAMLLQAAIAALLTRIGAGTDIPIGLVVAGRGDSATHDMIGFFVNTVVTRTDTSGDPEFSALLRTVRDAGVEAFDHFDLPFEQLVEALNPPRSAARHPLAQVMLSVQTGEPIDFRLPDLETSARAVENGTAKFDLSFKFEPQAGSGEFAGALEYNGDLFDRSTAERIGACLLRLLEDVAQRPHATLSGLEILSPAQRSAILAAAAGPELGPRSARTVAELFERQCDRAPDRIAVLQEDASWSYCEVEERANQYAWVLRNLGAGPEDRIGLCLHRGMELIAAVLGVWKAGAAYVPLDPQLPAERRAFLAVDSRISILICAPDLAADHPQLDPGRLILAGADPRLAAAPTERPPASATGGNLAYLVFTSGSTGRPKSVLIEQKSVVDRLTETVERFGLTEEDVNLQVISIGFEATVRELFGPLAVGGAVALLAHDEVRDPGVILAAIRRHRPSTMLCVVPSILESLRLYGADHADLSCLRIVGSGGEALRPEAAEEVVTGWGSALLNQYGPTETTMMACVHRVTPDDAGPRIPVGRPLGNTRIYVLDDNLQPAPDGVAGELYIAGSGLARGYAGAPGLTSTRFVADPFGASGERMYRTGDRGRMRPDGLFDLLGRTDDQIKIRGLRIEPGEIETVLAEHPAVLRAALAVREPKPGDRRLAAYYVPADPADPPSADALRRHAARFLPEQMVPWAYVPMAELPVRGNGKLNRDLLPEPELDAAHTASRAPRTPREEILCELFAEVLGLPGVGAEDDFFQFGGHSLLAARLLSRIRSVLGVDLAMRSLFEVPTPAGLAGRSGDEQESLEVLLPLRSGGADRPLFCVHPGAGISWSYSLLLRDIPASVPLYGLQSRGLMHPDDMPDTIEEMAADYVRWIRTVQPQGPYRLLGWSVGGVIAQEMAVQLQAEGESVELLALLDAYPGMPEQYRVDDATLLDSLPDPAAGSGAAPGPQQLERALELLREDGGALSSLSRDQVSAMLIAMAHNRRLVRVHEPGYLRGDVLFFFAGEDRPEGAPLPEDWESRISGRVIRHDIACAHVTMNQAAPMRQIGVIVAKSLSALRAIRETA